MMSDDKKLNSRDVRTAKILSMAANGVPIKTIARQNDCGVSTVERAVFSKVGQERLKEVMQECEAHINSQLPELLDLSLQNLKNVLTSNFASRNDQIRASEIVLKTALKLSEITSRV